jgi:hypothetical protein
MFQFICNFYYEHVAIWQLTFEIHPETNACINLQCTPFLSNFTHTWNVSSNFKKIPQFQISWKFVLALLRCYTRENGLDVTNRQILATFHREGHYASSFLWWSLWHTSSFRNEVTRWMHYADNHHFIFRPIPLHSTPYVRWITITNGEWERMWKEVVMVYLTLLFQHFLKWLGQSNQCRSPHEYEKGVQLLRGSTWHT